MYPDCNEILGLVSDYGIICSKVSKAVKNGGDILSWDMIL